MPADVQLSRSQELREQMNSEDNTDPDLLIKIAPWLNEYSVGDLRKITVKILMLPHDLYV